MSFSTAQLGPPLERRAWETLLERFEDAWHAGAPPSLEAFLAPLGSDPARAELLAELIQIDLDYRWRRIVKTPEAAPFILEDYLARFPELSVRDFAPLLAWEYRARHRWGDRPAHDDYARRFPQHAAQLADLLSRIDTELAREFSASRRLSSRTRPAPASTVKSAPVALSRDELIETLRQTAILTADQLDAVTAALPARNLAPEALVAELRNRGWLTVFQTQELLEGRGPDLVLGPYVLLERLGAGGVGQVFKARDRDRERLVALKVIRPELLQDAEVLRRFYREIQIVGRLHHPNLVEGYDSGPIGETHCLVMEYLEGVDLAQLVRERGPLPVAGACDYVRQAALGLQHAHERQLVHRDVKPANLLVSGDGESETSPQQVKVLDLGLARLRPTGDGEITGMLTAGQATSMLTPAGAFMIGTPDYLAPEQALDFHAADIRADIYSLGCTCYFLLTGQPPFPGGTLAQKLLWHQQAEVPAIEALRPDVPAALAEVLRRMLAKRPEDRWQTPGEVATALSDPAYQKLRQPPPASLPAVPAPVLHQTTVALSPARPSRRKSAALWPRALVLAVGCALVLFFVRPGPQEAPLPQPVVTPPTERELLPPPQPDHLAEAWAAVQAKAAKPGFDPEDLRGDILALRARFPGTQPAFRAAELLARLPSPLDQLDAARIPPALRLARQPSELVAVLGEPRNQNWGDIFRLSFRPDGKTLACGASSDKTVRVWDLAGTEPRRAQVISGYGYTANTLAFTPDGLGLSFIGDGCVVRHWDLANNRQQPWAVVLGPSSSTVVTSVAFAPDGKALAYGGEDCTVHLWDLARTESRERAVLRGHTGSVLALAFSPDGQTLASGSADRLVRLWDLTTQPPLERAALKGHHQRIQGLAFTPDGKSLLSCANDSSVRLWDLSTGKEKNVFRVSNNNFVAVTVTADGRRAAASSSGGSVVWWDLTTGTKGGEFQFPSGAWNVAFAPDGRHLAIGNGNGTVYILRLAQRPPLSER